MNTEVMITSGALQILCQTNPALLNYKNHVIDKLLFQNKTKDAHGNCTLDGIFSSKYSNEINFNS